MEELMEWVNSNGLALNSKKAKLMAFSSIELKQS